MMRCLNGHPDCAAYGESLFWGRLWHEPGPDGRYDSKQFERIVAHVDENRMGPVGGAGSLDFEEKEAVGRCAADALRELGPGCTPAEAFRAMGEAIAAHERKRCWVEKTPHHLWHLDRILEHLGPCRIVVMLRDPRAFLLSYKHQGDRRRPESRRRFHRLYHPASASWVCRRYLKSAIAARKLHGDEVIICFLEELIRDPDVQLRRVTDHLELDPFPTGTPFFKDNSSFTDAERPELAPAERTWNYLMASGPARELGMEQERPPMAPFHFAWSLLTLPFAALRALTVLPHIIRRSS